MSLKFQIPDKVDLGVVVVDDDPLFMEANLNVNGHISFTAMSNYQ